MKIKKWWKILVIIIVIGISLLWFSNTIDTVCLYVHDLNVTYHTENGYKEQLSEAIKLNQQHYIQDLSGAIQTNEDWRYRIIWDIVKNVSIRLVTVIILLGLGVYLSKRQIDYASKDKREIKR